MYFSTIADAIFYVEYHFIDSNYYTMRNINHTYAELACCEYIDDKYVIEASYPIDDLGYINKYQIDGEYGIKARCNIPIKWGSNVEQRIVVDSIYVHPSKIREVISRKCDTEYVIDCRVNIVPTHMRALVTTTIILKYYRPHMYVKGIKITLPQHVGNEWFRRFINLRYQISDLIMRDDTNDANVALAGEE